MRACGTASGSVIRVCADSGLWPCHMPMARVTNAGMHFVGYSKRHNAVRKRPDAAQRGLMRHKRGLMRHKRGLMRHKSGLVRCKKRPGGVQKEA